jgi:hypothetical protein
MVDILRIKFLKEGEPVFPHTHAINCHNGTQQTMNVAVTNAFQQAIRALPAHFNFRVLYKGDDEAVDVVARETVVEDIVAFCLNREHIPWCVVLTHTAAGAPIVNVDIDWDPSSAQVGSLVVHCKSSRRLRQMNLTSVLSNIVPFNPIFRHTKPAHAGWKHLYRIC